MLSRLHYSVVPLNIFESNTVSLGHTLLCVHANSATTERTFSPELHNET